MREDILDILWYAKRSGFEIIIYTNGSLINKRIADELSVLKTNKVVQRCLKVLLRELPEFQTRTKRF